MPAHKTYLELSDPDSGTHKFYEVTLDGISVTIRFGRIGAAGRTETQTFPDEVAARVFADAKRKEKTAKGYASSVPGARLPKPPASPPAPGSEAWFWKLIETAKRGTDGDCEAQCAVLQEKLTPLPIADIVAWKLLLDKMMDAAYRNDLWGAAYLIHGGCSDDSFDYFRGWLVLQGEKVYRAALEDPDGLARIVNEDDDVECEDVLYGPVKAYEAKTGRDDFYSLLPPRKPPALVGSDDWGDDTGDMDEQKGRQLYPRLWRKFMAD